MLNAIIIAKTPHQKLVRIINILKGNILNPIVIADKILSKTIKVTIGDCLIYIFKITRLFFKLLLPPLTKLY